MFNVRLMIVLLVALASARSFAKIEMPGLDKIPAQNDPSCSAHNTLARIFSFYGYPQVTYELLKTIITPLLTYKELQIGPIPTQIANQLNQSAGTIFPTRPDGEIPIRIVHGATMNEILTFIDLGVPVIAVLKNKLPSINFFGFNLPTLRYVIPVDYEMTSATKINYLGIMDNGLEKKISILDFVTQWIGPPESPWKINLASPLFQNMIGHLRKNGAEIYENKAPIFGGTLIVPRLPRTLEKAETKDLMKETDEGQKNPEFECKTTAAGFSSSTESQTQREVGQLTGPLKEEMNKNP